MASALQSVSTLSTLHTTFSDLISRSYRMSMAKALRFLQRRNFVSSVFGFTFVAAVATVSASAILPCPARPRRGRYADSEEPTIGNKPEVVKKTRRWIQETRPEIHPS
jgi:cytochrome c oxidase assembly factor 2